MYISSAAKLGFCILLCTITTQRTTNAASLLTSYLPASMQALAYYLDYLQYEPLSTTTVEPPFSVSDDDLNNIFNSVPASSGSGASTTTTTTPWHIATTTTSPWHTTETTTKKTTSTTTRHPISASSVGGGSTGMTTTSSWWQPPSWWQQTTTRTTRKPSPTPTHRPAVYAPPMPAPLKTNSDNLEGYELFSVIGDNSEGFDPLPLALIRDIQNEANHDEFTNDVESLDNFLRLYDDNYGRAAFDPDTAMDRWSSTSTAGKKRIPPTKPYVEFLLVYDLLKRDAKAANLSKYEGYSDELLKDLHELSKASAERQLYTLFKRMLERGDIQRSDVVSRIQGIMKDLANPNSATVKAMRYIPTLQFLP